MFLSFQTYEGLRITSYSLIEVTKYLLNAGMPYVFSECFSQDVLEEHFGRYHSLGRKNDNPTINQIGYQSNTLRMQCSIVPITGKTKGTHKKNLYHFRPLLMKLCLKTLRNLLCLFEKC